MSNLFTKLQISIALILSKQRCSSKADLKCVWENLIHHVVEFTGMSAVAFVDQKEDIFVQNLGAGFSCCFKLINCCGDNGISVVFQQRYQATASRCFHRIHARMNEVIPQLLDQIQTIADQYKSWICHTLVSDNTLYKHNHCQGFTASLCMPNDTAPAEAIILTVDTTHRIFNTKELLIAGNFLNATIIQNVKTNNIKQAPFAEHGHNSSVLLCDMAVIYIAFGSIGLPLHIFFVPLA